MNTFLTQFEDNNNFTLTENGAIANRSTKSKLLDLFALGGALRERSDNDIISLFNMAYSECELTALRMMFYFRDIRGGQGERKTFKLQLKELANTHPDKIIPNLHLIPKYGRWDDLFVLLDTPLKERTLGYIKGQFLQDLKLLEAGDAESLSKISLLGKWMKSENTSSRESRKLATEMRNYLRLSPKQYRKALSALRAHLKIVERDISNNDWKNVDYSKIPSKAGFKYRNAFLKHDESRYNEFISKVNSGEAKINAGTLYPYEIIEKIGIYNYNYCFRNEISSQVAQAYWDNLPDYISGNEESSIAVVDTSGSMTGRPIDVALSIGLYMAERANSAFKDHFITFSSCPELQKITGSDITTKVKGMCNANWENSTNLQAVFDLILRTALDNNVSPDDIPKKLYIISDMEFDCVVGGGNQTLFNEMKEKFNRNGFELPNIVFWNVDAGSNAVPAAMTDSGVQLVSGFSPSIFNWVMGEEFKSAYDLMMDVLNDERYSEITL